MRVILDTNILISAFIYGGTPQNVLETCVQETNIELFHSKHIVEECLRTIQKTQLQSALKKSEYKQERLHRILQ